MLRGSTSLRHRRSRIHCVQNCAWRKTDWREGITTTTVSLHLFICRVSWLALFTHSPRGVLPSTTAPQTVQMVIVWMAPLTDHIASGVPAKRNIARYRYYPIYANIAQFPITQYRYCSNPSIRVQMSDQSLFWCNVI